MTNAIDQIAELSERIGYRADAIFRNYDFSDLAAEHSKSSRRAALAVFTQTPPSYRSAAFGVSESSVMGPEATARQFRALGAPLFFVIEADDVSVWQIYANGPPRVIQSCKVHTLNNLFQVHRQDWMPDTIHRAKSIGQIDATYQLDFVDAGLIPALEGEIHDKLDRLLRESLAATDKETDNLNIPVLFQGVFRLLAAKILIDRKHQSATKWNTSDVASVLYEIGQYYRLPTAAFNPFEVAPALEDAWRVLFEGINVANISADDLAFVYENTLVTSKTRRLYSTHSTPRHVAGYIVRRLAFWQNQAQHPKIYEPFAGAGVFLVSALRHMREALPTSWNDKQRHDLLVSNIRGSEIDAFACEVAMLSLILADYPNTNGWQIENADLFQDGALETRLADADVVLCNPPFEAFTQEERGAYAAASARNTSKALSVLSTVLDAKPQAIGFVLPRTFLMDRAYRDQRETIEKIYGEVELVSLPDGVFAVSQIETALLIARDKRTPAGDRVILASEVKDSDRRNFVFSGLPTHTRKEVRSSSANAEGRLWIPPLRPLWQRLESFQTLGDYFTGHWGLRWKKGGQSLAATDGSDKFRKRGLLRVQDHRQFSLGRTQWINIRPDTLYAGGNLPWGDCKILCNAIRLSRGYWRFAAAVDEEGLVASQQFIGLWPKNTALQSDWDTIVAILNGPIANAFVTDHSTEKRFRIGTVLSIPMPIDLPSHVGILAKEYREVVRNNDLGLLRDPRLSVLLDEIDRTILEAYDLPPKLVRSLLTAFGSKERPVVHPWEPWGVNESGPALSLAELRENVLGSARGNWVQTELPAVSDEEAARAAPYLP